jgi:hypothetical protein
MRKLKIELADENEYIFSTLTLKEQTALRRYELMEKENKKKMEKLDNIEKERELTTEEEKQYLELQDRYIDSALKMLITSLAKNHKEFRTGDNNTIETILDKVKGLIDLHDMKRLITFVNTGALPISQEEEYEIDEIIDLTGKINIDLDSDE